MDKRYTVKVLNTAEENKSHKTLELELASDVKPGQFFMLTDYEHGEKPFSVSRITDDTISFTIKRTGPFSQFLCSLQKGDFISLRGPYGRGFDLPVMRGKRLLLLGGGCGTAPLRSLLEELAADTEVDFVNGARNGDELLFLASLAGAKRQFDCTDDGSAGEKGNVLDICSRHLVLSDYECIAVSGPEVMLKAVINSLDGLGVPSFLLIERYMKCAIGICGQCSLDPSGVRVCVEGPVFPLEKLAGLSEFGSYKRDAAGIKRDI